MRSSPSSSVENNWQRMARELRATWPELTEVELEAYRNDLGGLVQKLHKETGLDREGLHARIQYLEEKTEFTFEE